LANEEELVEIAGAAVQPEHVSIRLRKGDAGRTWRSV